MGATALLVAKSIQFSFLLQKTALLQMSSETELLGKDVEVEETLEVWLSKEILLLFWQNADQVNSVYADCCYSIFVLKTDDFYGRL